ncbi:MAG TPA: trigger factor [Streptosporangiaceae bacterium]
MKTDVEELSPTRVKLTIEVPFSELKPSLDKAYREVAKQVRIPGFRPGHVPPRVIDQRLGRSVVLEQAVNDAVPELYGKALQDNDVLALGQPEVEITQLDDGQQLAFTAEVDIRPKFDLPQLAGLPVTVDNAEVTPDEVEEYIAGLRERFASLRGVDRPAQAGDYVSIDLSASVGGTPVDDAQASGISYEVGSGTLVDGLDEALTGMSAGDAATFTSELAGGGRAGEQADVAVTVHSVKVKEMPELDDEFAQSASEYDTLGEFRASTRARLAGAKRMQQAGQARERALDAVLARVDIPLPERLVAEEIDRRDHSLDEQLERAGLTREAYLGSREMTSQALDDEIAADARRFVTASFVLDQIARQEELGVEQEELNAYIVEQAYRLGTPPDRLAKEIVDRGQLGVAVTEVLRAKALDLLAERATVTDEAGRPVDLKAVTTEQAVGEEAGEAGEAGDSETAGPDAAGPDGGQDEAGPDEAGSDKAGQDEAGQDDGATG